MGVKNNHYTEMCSGSEAGSYLRLIDSCITKLKAQGPSRSCNESKEEGSGLDPLHHALPHQVVLPRRGHRAGSAKGGARSQLENNYFTEMCSGSEPGSY